MDIAHCHDFFYSTGLGQKLYAAYRVFLSVFPDVQQVPRRGEHIGGGRGNYAAIGFVGCAESGISGR